MNENENLQEQETPELNLDDIMKEFAPEEGEVPEEAVLEEVYLIYMCPMTLFRGKNTRYSTTRNGKCITLPSAKVKTAI